MCTVSDVHIITFMHTRVHEHEYKDMHCVYTHARTHTHTHTQYYEECHGVVYVVDSCDPENLAMSSQTFSECVGMYQITCPIMTLPFLHIHMFTYSTELDYSHIDVDEYIRLRI